MCYVLCINKGDTQMTKAQVKKLHTIAAKLEALQNECANRSDKDDLMSAKKYLIYALNRNEH
jgi:hypothetical protein